MGAIRNAMRRTVRDGKPLAPPATMQEAKLRAQGYADEKGGDWYAFERENKTFDVSPEWPRENNLVQIIAVGPRRLYGHLDPRGTGVCLVASYYKPRRKEE